MTDSFVPPDIAQLTEATSIAFAQTIAQTKISTPLSAPIATAYVRQGAGSPPLLLLHGFDSSVFEFRRLLPLLAAERDALHRQCPNWHQAILVASAIVHPAAKTCKLMLSTDSSVYLCPAALY